MTTIRNAPGGAAATFNDDDSIPITRSPHAANTSNLYLTRAVLKAFTDTLYETTGAVAAHAALADPHPGYLTPAEGNVAYEAAGAVSAHAALADPHPTYLTAAEGNAAYQPLDTDLTQIAALTPTGGQSVRKNSGNTAWEAFTPGSGGSTSKAHIDGLQLTWVSASAINVSSGSAYVESLVGSVDVAATISLTGIALGASAWGYVYVKSDGTAECNTTAPASPYFGTARSKTADTTRRFLGAVKTDGTGNLIRFQHDPASDLVMWREQTGNIGRVLSGGAATVATAFSCAALVPPTTRVGFLRLINNAAAATARFNYWGSAEDAISTTPGTTEYAALAEGVNAILACPLDSTQRFSYYNNTAAAYSFCDVYGYYNAR